MAQPDSSEFSGPPRVIDAAVQREADGYADGRAGRSPLSSDGDYLIGYQRGFYEMNPRFGHPPEPPLINPAPCD